MAVHAVLWSNKGDKGVARSYHRPYEVWEILHFVYGPWPGELLRYEVSRYLGKYCTARKQVSDTLGVGRSRELVGAANDELGDEDYGMLWAPDVLYDRNRDDYVIHWSSSHASNNYGHKAIFYTRTKDFIHFDKPQLLCRKDGSGIMRLGYI